MLSAAPVERVDAFCQVKQKRKTLKAEQSSTLSLVIIALTDGICHPWLMRLILLWMRASVRCRTLTCRRRPACLAGRLRKPACRARWLKVTRITPADESTGSRQPRLRPASPKHRWRQGQCTHCSPDEAPRDLEYSNASWETPPKLALRTFWMPVRESRIRGGPNRAASESIGQLITQT